MDGWINGCSKILTVLFGDADWRSVLELGEVDRGWDGCVGIGDDFLGTNLNGRKGCTRNGHDVCVDG
jgi:hypothetical protein